MRSDPREPTPKTYALPPIEGFSPIPIQDLWEWTPAEDEAHYDLFTIELENVVADDVREIWIQDYRFTGAARVRGGFLLRPTKELEVGPARFETDGGEVRVGTDVVAQLRGSIDVTMRRFSLPEWPDAEVTNALDRVDARLDGTIPSWEFLRRRYLDASAPDLAGGASSFHVDVHVRDGELWTGTKIGVEMRELQVEAPKATISASAQASVEVTEERGDRTLTLAADARPFEVRIDGASAFPIRAPTLALFATSHNLALRKPFNDARISLDAPDAQITDLRIVQKLLPKDSKLVIDGGAAIGHAHLDALPASGFGEASLSLSTHTARLHVGDDAVSGDVGVDLELARLDLVSHDATLTGTIDLRDVVLEKDGERSAPWWARVELHDSALRPNARTKLAVSASARMRDVRPLLALYASAEGMPSWLQSVLAMEDFRATAELRLGDGIDLDDLRASSTDVALGAKVHVHEATRGAILVVYRGLLVGIDLQGGSVKPVLTGVREWFDSAR